MNGEPAAREIDPAVPATGAYVPPTVTDLGSLADLTMGSGDGGADGSGSAPVTGSV